MNPEQLRGHQEWLDRHWKTNRTAVCEASNRVAREVAERCGGSLLTVSSGEECLSWVIPPRWEVNEAWIRDLATGAVVVDFAEHPLAVWSYSDSFEGELSFEELEPHLKWNEVQPSAIPYHYRFQYDMRASGWGFSLPFERYRALPRNGRFQVCLDTTCQPGEMQVADCLLPGASPTTIFMAAHTCHPGQVNDGLLNVAALMVAYRALSERPRRRYTYRLLAGPEYFAAAAVLARAPGVGNLRYGVYLDLVANGTPLGFSRSFLGTSPIDRAIELAAREQLGAGGYQAAGYRERIANDEMFYDGPDFGLPMVGLNREISPVYHSHLDDPDQIDWRQFEETVSVLLNAFDILEADRIPLRQWRGPLYLSRYGIDPGPLSNRLQVAQMLMDGARPISEIALRADLPFASLWQVCDLLHARGQLELVEPPNQRSHED